MNGDAYATAMQKALDIVEKIKLAWKGINGLKDDGGKDDDPSGKKDTLPAGVALLNSSQSVADRAASAAAFKESGLSVSGYIKKVDADQAAAAKARAVAAQKSTKEAQVKSGLSVSAYSKQVDSRAAANPSGVQLRNLLRNASGGLVNYMSNGGAPRFAKPSWAKAMGTDIVPAMLTPGEFVISRPAVSKIGVKSLNSINNGEYPGGSVYNYNLSVNVSSMSDPNDIAQTVMAQIRRVESQRIRSNKF